MGCLVTIKEDTVSILVVMPLMQRAHTLQESAGLCFVNSTASHDAQNLSVTFMLTTCATGAVPLAVVITEGQTQDDCTAGSSQLRNCDMPLFGGDGHPAVFMTDDSEAEQSNIHSVWPESRQTLCLFHVPQANWRWIWDSKNKVAKDDRPVLMLEFRSMMLASTLVVCLVLICDMDRSQQPLRCS